MCEKGGVLLSVLQEADAKIALDREPMCLGKMPIKDKRGRKQEWEGRPLDHNVGLTPIKGGRGKGRLGRKSLRLQGSSGKVSARWMESLRAKAVLYY